jgi:Mrp family chromosome partitioning ATPase
LQREAALTQAELDRQIAATGAQKGMLAGLEVLEQQAASSRELYETFLLRFMNLQTIVDLIESDVQMVDAANLPRWPSSVGNGRLMAFAVLAALLGGFFLALTADQRDRSSIRTEQDVQLRLGAAVLGAVPRIGRLTRLVRWLRRGRITPNPPLSAQAEALRAIEAKLRRYAADSRVVLVTSSLRREGRTTFACGLHEAAARGGRPTALIDLDFRRPGVLRQLGIEHAPDLARWLEGHDRTHLPVHHDPVSGIDVLAPSAAPADPTRLIRSLRLEELLAELRQRYDRVVIDGGPVLGISETLLLAELADNVVFGVQSGRTPAALALEGLRQAGRRADLVGVALLRVKRAAAPFRAAVARQRRNARHGVSVPAAG